MMLVGVGGCSAAESVEPPPEQAQAPAGSPAQVTPFDHGHLQFDSLLRKVVDDGQVRYGELAADRGSLDGYLATLASVTPEELAGFGREQRMALWINAYNASTLALILDNGPLGSIRDIEEPWDGPRFQVAGREVSLNHIEHEILRKQYPDARLHMVLVCAARSCPKLQSHAYVGDGLEAQMDEASRGFVQDGSRNRFDAEASVLHVSRIFEWYGGDFVAQYAQRGGGGDQQAAIRGFFSSYLSDEAVSSPDVRVEWLEYDWALNGSF